MKFGLGPLTTQVPPDDPRTPSEKLEQTVEMAQAAEDAGFDSVWLSEHHGAEDGYLSSPFTLAGAIAHATERVNIGTSIALAPFYDPTRLAEDAATVDDLSGGRFILGLGMGYQDEEFRRFGIDKSQRVSRLVDAVNLCRRAWTGEPFSYEGEIYHYSDIRATPPPVQGPDLPIVIGALAEPAVRRAARIADGVIGVWLMPPEQIGQMQQWAKEEGKDRTSFRTHLFREAFLADSHEQAWNTVKDGVYYVNKKYYDAFEESSDEAEYPFPEEETLKSWGLYGTAEDIAEGLRAFEPVLSPRDHVILRLEFPGVSHEAVLDSIRRAGRDLIPLLGNG